jgi:hypothetical protein
MKLGDVISSVATPIAAALHLPCVDPKTGKLRPESGCAKRRDKLNDLSDTVYDVFWTQKPKGKEN